MTLQTHPTEGIYGHIRLPVHVMDGVEFIFDAISCHLKGLVNVVCYVHVLMTAYIVVKMESRIVH